jgi:hypothetical protein
MFACSHERADFEDSFEITGVFSALRFELKERNEGKDSGMTIGRTSETNRK